MFRATIEASESTDVDATLAMLQGKGERSGLSGPELSLALAQTRAVLSELVQRGKELAAIGSQMRVTRELTGEKFSITLIMGAGERPSLLNRLARALRGG